MECVPHSNMSRVIVERGTNSIGQLAGPVRWSLKMACRISKSFVSLFGWFGHLQRRISERLTKLVRT